MASLTAKEKEILTQGWAAATKDKKALGAAIFLKLFDMHPEVQQMFRHFKGKSCSELKSSPALKAHGLRVVNTLDAVMTDLDDAASSTESLRLIGESHAKRGVVKDHFVALNGVLAVVFTERLGTAFTDNQDIWIKFLTAIVPVIAEGLES